MKHILLPAVIALSLTITASVPAATYAIHPKAIYPLAMMTIGEYMSTVQAEETQAATSTTSMQTSTITLPSTPPTSVDVSVGIFLKNISANTTHFLKRLSL